MRIGSAKGVDSLNVAHLLGVVHIRGGVEINHTHSASEHHHPLIGVGDCQKEANLAHRTKGTKVTKKMSRHTKAQIWIISLQSEGSCQKKKTVFFGRSLPNLFTHPPTPGFL